MSDHRERRWKLLRECADQSPHVHKTLMCDIHRDDLRELLDAREALASAERREELKDGELAQLQKRVTRLLERLADAVSELSGCKPQTSEPPASDDLAREWLYQASVRSPSCDAEIRQLARGALDRNRIERELLAMCRAIDRDPEANRSSILPAEIRRVLRGES